MVANDEHVQFVGPKNWALALSMEGATRPHPSCPYDRAMTSTWFCGDFEAVFAASGWHQPQLWASCEVRRRRDDIPSSAPVTDLVEGRELARDGVGFVVGRRRSRHQSDAARRHRQSAKGASSAQSAASPDAVFTVSAKDVARDEHHVETGAFGGLNKRDILI